MGAVLSCIQGVLRAIGNCLMAIVNAIGSILMAIVNGVVTVFDVIISFLTCQTCRGGGMRRRRGHTSSRGHMGGRVV